MKKSIFILLTIYFLIQAVPGFAQIQVGPSIGVNLSGLSIDPGGGGQTTNIKSGFSAGALIVYKFFPMFGIQLEPVYIQKGAYINTAMTDMGAIIELKQTAEINYVDIPLSFRVSFEAESVKPFLFAGMNIAFPLKDIKIKIDNITVNGEDFTQYFPPELMEQQLKTKKIDYGVNFGAGISFPLSIIDIFLEAQYNLGLSNLNDEQVSEGEQKITLKNKGFQIKTGVLFTF